MIYLKFVILLLRSTIGERNPNPGRSEIEIFSVVDGWTDNNLAPPPPKIFAGA